MEKYKAVYGWCDADGCNYQGYVAMIKIKGGKINHLCPRCLMASSQSVSHRDKSKKKVDTQAQDNDPHQ